VSEKELEGAKAMEFTTMNTFVVARLDQLMVYDSVTFEELDRIPINLMDSAEREPNEILAIQKCQNEEYLAIITGKNLIMAE
jgi:hypothetical protein